MIGKVRSPAARVVVVVAVAAAVCWASSSPLFLSFLVSPAPAPLGARGSIKKTDLVVVVVGDRAPPVAVVVVVVGHAAAAVVVVVGHAAAAAPVVVVVGHAAAAPVVVVVRRAAAAVVVDDGAAAGVGRRDRAAAVVVGDRPAARVGVVVDDRGLLGAAELLVLSGVALVAVDRVFVVRLARAALGLVVVPALVRGRGRRGEEVPAEGRGDALSC